MPIALLPKPVLVALAKDLAMCTILVLNTQFVLTRITAATVVALKVFKEMDM